MQVDLPKRALSVRQPWAWAILHGGKTIENRSKGAIRAGRMTTGPISLHAAKGMREAEYNWAVWKMAEIGVQVPAPLDLPRGAIIGRVDVVDIVSASDSPWFGGAMGLVLDNPVAVSPIACPGALGYFNWTASGDLAPPARWMHRVTAGYAPETTPELFDDLPVAFRAPPKKPFH